MIIVKRFFKYLLIFLSLPLLYLIVSVILSFITINDSMYIYENKIIYLNTNGIHLDIIIPKNSLNNSLSKNLILLENEKYVSFGWGDENFYINTPTWDDLTFGNAFSALFLKSSTLMHVTRYKNQKPEWIKIQVNDEQLEKLNNYINNSFITENSNKQILENEGYFNNDNFYKAKGNYSIFNTCNSWVNSIFKKSGLKSCFWTPFDFGLLNKYE